MKKYIYSLLIVQLLALSFWGCSSDESRNSSKSQRYENPRIGFSITVPSLWKIQEEPLFVLFFPPNVVMNTGPLGAFPQNYQSFEYLMVSYCKSKPNKTLKDMANMYIKGTQIFNSTYTAGPLQQIEISNIHCVFFEDSMNENGYNVNGIVFMVPNGERVLTLMFRADPDMYKNNKNLYEGISISFLILS